MKKIYDAGDSMTIHLEVNPGDVAEFVTGTVHHVCSTFALGRNVEWATRQYVLNMLEDDEEGIGTFLSIDHKSPALVGEILTIYSEVISFKGNEIICAFEVRVNERMIATGKTGQKILKKEKLKKIFSSLEDHEKEN